MGQDGSGIPVACLRRRQPEGDRLGTTESRIEAIDEVEYSHAMGTVEFGIGIILSTHERDPHYRFRLGVADDARQVAPGHGCLRRPVDRCAGRPQQIGLAGRNRGDDVLAESGSVRHRLARGQPVGRGDLACAVHAERRAPVASGGRGPGDGHCDAALHDHDGAEHRRALGDRALGIAPL